MDCSIIVPSRCVVDELVGRSVLLRLGFSGVPGCSGLVSHFGGLTYSPRNGCAMYCD